MTLGVSGWFSLMSAVALGCLACNRERAQGGVASVTAAPKAMESPNLGTSGRSPANEHLDHDCATHATPLRPAPPGASATALQPQDLQRLTGVRISAHAGSVLLRKQNGAWLSVGRSGCTVAPERMAKALTNLTELSASSRPTGWPSEADFELQIDVLMGEEHAIHFEIGTRDGDTDLVKLLNGDVVELRGLDRGLWSTDPAVWCSQP